jgi:hypothetical protein
MINRVRTLPASSLLGLCLCLLVLHSAEAGNIRFLPGDAYFEFQLTHDDVTKLRKGEAIRFKYVMSGPGYFCGNAAYGLINSASFPKADVETLCSLYDEQRRSFQREVRIHVAPDGREVFEELNPMTVFVVARDFDVKKDLIGLRYNENWVKELRRIHGLPETSTVRGDSVIQSRARNPDLVAMEWRDAELVPALPVKCDPPRISDMVALDGPAQFLLMPGGFKDYLDLNDRPGHFLRIQEREVSSFSWDDEEQKWHERAYESNGKN